MTPGNDLAFPRRVYAQSHADRQRLRGYRIVEEAPFLRHFTAKLLPVG